ncbi:histidinol dehydrogenase [Bacillus horti]|uniref:Histidinol dehydrogenase n=1 Tax=Caldalkalibacillus horti TaxID=77523 RepID=A0ABT9W365_9BACI|nr:histidinol dehydrogenase [Bacillus horti]MDQ0167688.1 histidinol dehydrogenase [Bacillus horti]
MIKIIERKAQDATASLQRSIETGTKEQRQAVWDIIEQVKANGDRALFQLTHQFDGVQLDTLNVSEEEIQEAYKFVDEETVETFKQAITNIVQFHEKQKRESWMYSNPNGTKLGMKLRPLQRVGLYVPGGTAALLSSVLMTAIPAQVAGVQQLVLTTPPSKTGKVAPTVLVAADLLGIREIYSVGGAQAIAALAYGTETIKGVDKIVGPGNIYVALAKREVFGTVDIDMIAGPSEIVVLADEQQNPAYIAADLLSQAEHDVLASAICVTTSKELAQDVQAELVKQVQKLPRREIALKALEQHGAIYVTETLEEALDIVNQLAPEHLELMVEEPFELLDSIHHAGAVFLGEYSSEPVGDYFAGPNHVLPTNGSARFSSPLNVDDFMKKSSIIAYSKQDLMENADKIMRIARFEELEGHAQAIQIRLEQSSKD